nr:hypothetical protein BgiMline_022881 [Biomphalaria glabrata]
MFQRGTRTHDALTRDRHQHVPKRDQDERSPYPRPTSACSKEGPGRTMPVPETDISMFQRGTRTKDPLTRDRHQHVPKRDQDERSPYPRPTSACSKEGPGRKVPYPRPTSSCSKEGPGRTIPLPETDIIMFQRGTRTHDYLTRDRRQHVPKRDQDARLPYPRPTSACSKEGPGRTISLPETDVSMFQRGTRTHDLLTRDRRQHVPKRDQDARSPYPRPTSACSKEGPGRTMPLPVTDISMFQRGTRTHDALTQDRHQHVPKRDQDARCPYPRPTSACSKEGPGRKIPLPETDISMFQRGTRTHDARTRDRYQHVPKRDQDERSPYPRPTSACSKEGPGRKIPLSETDISMLQRGTRTKGPLPETDIIMFQRGTRTHDPLTRDRHHHVPKRDQDARLPYPRPTSACSKEGPGRTITLPETDVSMFQRGTRTHDLLTRDRRQHVPKRDQDARSPYPRPTSACSKEGPGRTISLPETDVSMFQRETRTHDPLTRDRRQHVPKRDQDARSPYPRPIVIEGLSNGLLRHILWAVERGTVGIPE